MTKYEDHWCDALTNWLNKSMLSRNLNLSDYQMQKIALRWVLI